MGKMYKTMQGKIVDMDKLITQNELMPAIGNIKVNARGDELGAGGQIVRKREDVVSEYYQAASAIQSDNIDIPTAKPEAPTINASVKAPAKQTKIIDIEE